MKKKLNHQISEKDIHFLHFIRDGKGFGIGLYYLQALEDCKPEIICSMCFTHRNDQYNRKKARLMITGRINAQYEDYTGFYTHTFRCFTSLPLKELKDWMFSPEGNDPCYHNYQLWIMLDNRVKIHADYTFAAFKNMITRKCNGQ